MKQFALICLCASVATITVLGCGRRRTTVRYEEHYEPVVHERVYVDTHVCTRSCHGHSWDGHRVVEIVGRHHHGPDCGHRWDGAHWAVVVDPAFRVDRGRRHVEPDRGHRHPPVQVERHRDGSRPAYKSKNGKTHKPKKGHVHKSKRGHTHDALCGCVYDGHRSKWVKIKAQGHRHGPKCGHVHISGRWTLRR